MADLPQKVAKLEVRHDQLQKDIDDIKLQVSNHIPTEIASVKKVVYELRDVHIADTAVSKAWNNNLKKTIIIVGCVFTVLRIVEFLMSVVK
jgi:hypothetical protein